MSKIEDNIQNAQKANSCQLKTFLKTHKNKLLILILVLLVIGGGLYFLSAPVRQAEMALEETAPVGLRKEDLPTVPPVPVVEIKEGRITRETTSADEDADKIKGYVEDYDGYIENFQKSDTYRAIKIVLRARVPFDKFDGFFGKILKEFKIKESDVQFYRLASGREITELDILDKTMKDLENIRAEINRLPVGRDKIDLLMELTDRQLTTRQKMRDFTAQLEAKRASANFSTVVITLDQEKPIAIVPEDLGRQFNEKLREMVQSSATTLMDIVTGILPLILVVIKNIIYAVIIILPAIAVFIFIIIFSKKLYFKIKKI